MEFTCSLLKRALMRFSCAFQVLKWFLFLLRVTCASFVCLTKIVVWQASVVRATESQKNSSEHILSHPLPWMEKQSVEGLPSVRIYTPVKCG